MQAGGAKPSRDAAVEIRIRFEPGLGSRLYASLRSGQIGPLTVARSLGRGKTLLRYQGYTLMAHGAPEWQAGDSFPVFVKHLGPPLVLARVGDPSNGRSGPVLTVDTAVVPGPVEMAS